MISSKDKKKDLDKIRNPAVAGSFYPANKKDLGYWIESFLKNTTKINQEGKPAILIVPHAGIIYSGQTAAWGFKQLVNEDYQQVILLGASHSHWFSYVAVDGSDFWQTPLGQVKLDQELARSLVDNKTIIFDEKPFLDEHCLEVELIFLQAILSNFRIVPVLVSDLSQEKAKFLAKKIANCFNEKTLLVISSDLSHYPPYELAKEVDQKTIDAILTGNSDRFLETIIEVENAGYSGLETAACGQKAVNIGLLLGKILKIKDWRLINYSNSGDFFGSKEQVVGYASIIGFSQKQPISQVSFLSQKEAKKALLIARETLESYVKKRVIPEFEIKEKGLLTRLGCFATLRKNGALRGCIGEFEPNQPLFQVIQRTVIKSAFSDPRFFPVTQEELSAIKIELSIISKKKLIDNWQEIKLGNQGVLIEGYGRAGTFLPAVAKETGWSLREFLSNLCLEKAGLPANCYQDPKVKIYVYEVQEISE